MAPATRILVPPRVPAPRDRLEHLQRVAAADAAAVLLLHPEGGGGGEGEGSDEDASVSEVTGAAAGGTGGAAGAAVLKMQTIMALTSVLAGKKVAMVVQVRCRRGVRAAAGKRVGHGMHASAALGS